MYIQAQHTKENMCVPFRVLCVPFRSQGVSRVYTHWPIHPSFAFRPHHTHPLVCTATDSKAADQSQGEAFTWSRRVLHARFSVEGHHGRGGLFHERQERAMRAMLAGCEGCGLGVRILGRLVA